MLEVNPVANKLFARRAFTLRDLILVMREDEIDAACVNVERLTKILHRHRRAFDMPAGTAATDRSVPRRLALVGWIFPEREVARVFLLVLVSVDSIARAGDVTREVDLRELAVLGKRGDAIVDRIV